jgi:hypothetical protein
VAVRCRLRPRGHRADEPAGGGQRAANGRVSPPSASCRISLDGEVMHRCSARWARSRAAGALLGAVATADGRDRRRRAVRRRLLAYQLTTQRGAPAAPLALLLGVREATSQRSEVLDELATDGATYTLRLDPLTRAVGVAREATGAEVPAAAASVLQRCRAAFRRCVRVLALGGGRSRCRPMSNRRRRSRHGARPRAGPCDHGVRERRRAPGRSLARDARAARDRRRGRRLRSGRCASCPAEVSGYGVLER